MAPIRYIVSLQIFWKKNPFRTFLYVYNEKDFFLVLEIKGVFFKNHTTPWQEMTYIVFTTRNNPSAFIQAYINVDNKRRIERRIERCCEEQGMLYTALNTIKGRISPDIVQRISAKQ